MSDTPQGDGWWQTSDGKWHPPEYDPTAPTAPEGAAGGSVPNVEPGQGVEAGSPPPPWSPVGGGPADSAAGSASQWGQDPPRWGDQPPPPVDPPAEGPPPGHPPPTPPFSETSGREQNQASDQPQPPGPPLFGDTGTGQAAGSPSLGDDQGPFATSRPGEFGLPSEVKAHTEPKAVRTSVVPGGDGPSGTTSVGTSPVLLWSGVAAAVLLVLFAGWYFLLRSDGSDEGAATATTPDPTVAAETTVSAPEDSASEAPSTETTTSAPLPPKPTIAPGAELPVLEFNGSGDSTVTLDPPGPRVANIEYTGTGPFSVTGLDANDGEVATVVESDGPYTGSVAVDFRDEQDSRSLSVEADGPWSIRMVPVESLQPIPGGFTGNGDNVVLYSGGVGPVTLSHSGSGPFKVNYFEITTREIETIADATGPFEGTAELRGPAFVWITANGDWSVTPG